MRTISEIEKLIEEIKSANRNYAKNLILLKIGFELPSDRRSCQSSTMILRRSLELNQSSMEIDDENEINNTPSINRTKEKKDFAIAKIIPRCSFNKLQKKVQSIIEEIKKFTLPSPSNDVSGSTRILSRLVLRNDHTAIKEEIERIKIDFEEFYKNEIINNLEHFKRLASEGRPDNVVEEIHKKIDSLSNSGKFYYVTDEFMTPIGFDIDNLIAKNTSEDSQEFKEALNILLQTECGFANLMKIQNEKIKKIFNGERLFSDSIKDATEQLDLLTQQLDEIIQASNGERLKSLNEMSKNISQILFNIYSMIQDEFDNQDLEAWKLVLNSYLNKWNEEYQTIYGWTKTNSEIHKYTVNNAKQKLEWATNSLILTLTDQIKWFESKKKTTKTGYKLAETVEFKVCLLKNCLYEYQLNSSLFSEINESLQNDAFQLENYEVRKNISKTDITRRELAHEKYKKQVENLLEKCKLFLAEIETDQLKPIQIEPIIDNSNTLEEMFTKGQVKTSDYFL